MNSNYGKTGSSFNTLDFDLGLGSNRSKSLHEQKNKSNSSFSYTSSSSSFSQPKPATTTPSWQPGKPSWTHQPAPSQTGVTRSELGGPTSMAGDIFGKSWKSTAPTSSGLGVGIVNKNPNLFGDLVGSALGQNKSNNAPLKSATPTKSSFLMGGMGDSLPKTNDSSVKSGGASRGLSQNVGSFGSVANSNGGYGNSSMNKSSNLGGSSMRSVGSGSGGIGIGMSLKKDPFGSLVDFGSKPMGGSKAGSTASEEFAFGDFQNASKSKAASAFPSGSSNPIGSKSNTASFPEMDSFVPQNPTPIPSAGADSFDMFFSSSSATGGTCTAVSDDATGEQLFSGGDDWGLDSGFGGGNDGGNTTELEGLPPPPSGVSASVAKTKGLDNYKQGQYADAIKWLSWAEVLLEKVGDSAGNMEVLTCRASCYKEVGEYKKAVADCTKVLDQDGTNLAVLVQRALLYESMEKYRLGADDLRTVMKLDPGNRVARSTIHRLNKLAD